MKTEFEVDVFNQYKLPTNKKKSTCPVCSSQRKKKTQECLMLDWERGLGTCQHCGEILQLHTYKFEKDSNAVNYITPKTIVSQSTSDGVINWFKTRNISEETVKDLKVTNGNEYMPQVSKEVNAIFFNYYVQGKIVNIKYRDAQKNFKMYKGAQKTFYNIDSIMGRDECVITEGEIDTMSYHESGIKNVVSVPNGFNSSGQVNLDYLTDFYFAFESKSKIYLALDADQAGENGKKEFIRRFGSDKCYLVNFKDCKDANEYLIKYGKEALKNTIADSIPCPIENVIRVNDMTSELDSFYKNGVENGYKIGLSSFDGIFSTYTKQFTVVTGFPSSGKSDFVDQMTVGYNMMYNWKIAYASTENYPQYLHVDKLVRKYYGRTPEYNDTKEMPWKECVSHVNKNFFFINYDDGYDLDKVLKKGEELVRRMGIRCLVIDPYNKVKDKASSNLSINDYTNAYLNKIDNWCKKNDCIIILVAHPTKPQTDKGKVFEPTFYDVKGGGEFYDMSPHGLLVHRDYEQGTVKVKVLKVKFSNLGENQADVNYFWNVNNGRYTEMINGDPRWDNTNWITSSKTPFDKNKELDKEFKQIEI
mgnify:FL=1|tara:strand:+ start:4320 stop:6083 length:1764 start_codon:yes stop_codon:yes gene_type:complete